MRLPWYTLWTIAAWQAPWCPHQKGWAYASWRCTLSCAPWICRLCHTSNVTTYCYACEEHNSMRQSSRFYLRCKIFNWFPCSCSTDLCECWRWEPSWDSTRLCLRTYRTLRADTSLSRCWWHRDLHIDLLGSNFGWFDALMGLPWDFHAMAQWQNTRMFTEDPLTGYHTSAGRHAHPDLHWWFTWTPWPWRPTCHYMGLRHSWMVRRWMETCRLVWRRSGFGSTIGFMVWGPVWHSSRRWDICIARGLSLDFASRAFCGLSSILGLSAGLEHVYWPIQHQARGWTYAAHQSHSSCKFWHIGQVGIKSNMFVHIKDILAMNWQTLLPEEYAKDSWNRVPFQDIMQNGSMAIPLGYFKLVWSWTSSSDLWLCLKWMRRRSPSPQDSIQIYHRTGCHNFLLLRKKRPPFLLHCS